MTENIDIYCAEYVLKSSSIGHSQAGSVFRCTISPVSDGLMASWIAATRASAWIRLAFPDQPLLLERVTLERVEPMSVRIVGRIVVSSRQREEPLASQSPNSKGLPW
jgi:hypothetical protein